MGKWTDTAMAIKKQNDALRSRLIDAEAALDKLQAFVDTPDWGVLDSGASIAEGTVVRYGLLRYRARTAHTKALTRSPLNLIYWEVLTDGQ